MSPMECRALVYVYTDVLAKLSQDLQEKEATLKGEWPQTPCELHVHNVSEYVFTGLTESLRESDEKIKGKQFHVNKGGYVHVVRLPRN